MLYLLIAVAVLLLDEELAVVAQGVCLQPANPQGLPPLPQGVGVGVNLRLPRDTQTIITSYQFRCCGNITGWQTIVEPFGPAERDGAYTIMFQVWRPGPTVDNDGCYSLVGEDFYPNIQLGEQGLVNRTLEPANYIQVRPGDVVGYFQTRRGGIEGEGEGIVHEQNELEEEGEEEGEDEGEEVWYFTNTEANPLVSTGLACLFTVGPGRALSFFTDSSPIIHVDIDHFPCTNEVVTTPQEPTNPTFKPPLATQEHTTIATPTSKSPPTSKSRLSAGILATTIVDAALLSLLVILVTCIIFFTCQMKARRISINTEPEAIHMKTNNAYSHTGSTSRGNSRGYSTTSERICGIHAPTILLSSSRDIDFTENRAYTTTSIPVETNQCYGTTTPSVGTDQLYATVEREHQPQDMELTLAESQIEEYDYVIP